MRTTFILDAHGLLYQLFHALPPMSSPNGEPVGAVFGFTKDLFSLIDKYHPDVLFCAFDLPGETFRHELYSEYKANRSAMPDDLRPQIQFAREILEAFRITPLSHPGFEADDILATVARLTAERNENCVIVSSDKDCRQLINDHVSLLNIRKQSFYRAEELFADWGIRPEQVVDFQSFVGDPTDNVPGVPLIGPKIASELLQKYETLEGVFENVKNIAGKKRQENIQNGKEMALLSRQLVRLNDSVPIEIEWNEYRGFDVERLRELFKRFGFRSLLDKLMKTLTGPQPADCDSRAGDCVAEKSQSAGCGSATYHIIDTVEKFESFLTQLQSQQIFSFDTETTAMDPHFDAVSPRYTAIVGMSFAWNDSEAYYLPFRAPLGSQILHLQQTLKKLQPVFEDSGIHKIGQNIKYDAVVLRNAGINLQGIAFDTMLADYLLRSEMPHNLDDMAEHYLQYRTIKIAELIGTGKKQKTMDTVQTDVMARYAGEDALVAWCLYQVLAPTLTLPPGEEGILDASSPCEDGLNNALTPCEDGLNNVPSPCEEGLNNVPSPLGGRARVGAEALTSLAPTLTLPPGGEGILIGPPPEGEGTLHTLFYDIELPLLSVLTEMESIGMTVDSPTLRLLNQRFAEKQSVLEKEIYELAGHSFNIASPKQLSTVLFDELGLRNVKKTKSGQSTDMEVLEELTNDHPLPSKVIEHRQLAKLRGTYVEALPLLIHPQTGRIHSSFNQVVTATGRLSSSHPNLQNIPVRTAEGREIRNAFVPGEGFDLLLSCDYSQIELRVLAHFSGDEKLCEAFQNNEDIHTRVAGEVFGVKPEDVDSDMRRIAKTVNFGVIYGQSAFGLSKQLGIAQKDAQKFIDDYFAKYSGIPQFLDSILEDCIVKGYVSTLFGRRRYFAPGTIRTFRKGSLNTAERMAINTVIQGTAADLMKQAMVKLCLDDFEANLLLQIHDELVFEVTEKDADRLTDYVVKAMQLDQPLKVPLAVDAELGKCWT